ncbi:hypothetical protein [Streptomyces sp. NBC_00239]|uniref:hypothetical protein n=1 Tax=Streptomyces sp. NBC_00239 TaxID=2903640 RepID=UPI002E29DA08|nr:hypothetical protein [Streptomyces sp. NBC_00239]
MRPPTRLLPRPVPRPHARPLPGPLPRLAAPVSLTLLPLLLLGATGCQSAPEGAAGAPAVAPAVPAQDDRAAVDEGERQPPAPDAPPAKAARVGEPVRVHGRGVGRHLQAVLDAFVDPAVSVDKGFTPAKGTRWVGADMSFVNVGGASYGALGRMWAIDGEGRRHPSLQTGRLSTGAPIAFESLEVGERVEGWVVFEIPENVRIVQLQYRDANMLPNSREGYWHI